MQIKDHHFFGKWEISYLTLNLVTYRIFTYLPALFSKDSGTAAPLCALISGIAALVIISLLLLLYKVCHCRNVIELAQKTLGQIGKYIVCIILSLYLLLSSSFALREFSLLVGQIAFPSAPLWFIAVFFVIAALFASLRGLDGIIRTYVILIPIVLLFTGIVLISVFGYAEHDNLFPILGNGIKPIFKSSLNGLLVFSDIVLLFLISPFGGEDSKSELKTVFFSAAGGILVVTALVFMFTATTAYPEIQSVRFPVYQLLKMVYYGRFFQRIDALYMLMAILSGMLQLSTAVFLTAHTSKLLFKPKAVSEKRAVSVYSVLSIGIVFALALSYDILSDAHLLQYLCIFALASLIATIIPAICNVFSNRTQKTNEE